MTTILPYRALSDRTFLMPERKRSFTMISERTLSPNLEFSGTADVPARSLARISLRRAVEQTDWDEKVLLQENRLNAWCWTALALACACISPFLATILLP
jgi:hypothetical protein